MRTHLRCLLAILLGATVGLAAGQEQPVAEDTRPGQLEVEWIRDLYREVKAGIADRRLAVTVRKFSYCRPYADTKRTLATEPGRAVRHYRVEGGSDDSALQREFYYDSERRLRFVRIEGAAVNGTWIDHEIYFDEAGVRILEEHNRLRGPGYTFPEVWPKEDLVFEPESAFLATSPCQEIAIQQ